MQRDRIASKGNVSSFCSWLEEPSLSLRDIPRIIGGSRCDNQIPKSSSLMIAKTIISGKPEHLKAPSLDPRQFGTSPQRTNLAPHHNPVPEKLMLDIKIDLGAIAKPPLQTTPNGYFHLKVSRQKGDKNFSRDCTPWFTCEEWEASVRMSPQIYFNLLHSLTHF